MRKLSPTCENEKQVDDLEKKGILSGLDQSINAWTLEIIEDHCAVGCFDGLFID